MNGAYNYNMNMMGGQQPSLTPNQIQQMYGNNLNQFYPQSQIGMNMPQQQMSSSNLQSINGKIVDSIDVVKATEVPLGGYGIFPKGDLSEIYLKTWNGNGTSSIISFKPVIESASPSIDINEQILLKINNLEEKLNNILNTKENNLNTTVKDGNPNAIY